MRLLFEQLSNWLQSFLAGICQFGLAHVDTPKGDLDASSGALSGADVPVIPNDAVYPFGTTEQYPQTVDLDGNLIANSAHEYRECSNKGMCDRQTGNCACFEGYDGSACQRASCPSNADGVCSGHGTCDTIKEIAANDFGNIYKLWDEEATMGCVCDAGYSGSDCSERVCKWGADPLYYDDEQNIRFSNFTYEFYTTATGRALTGNYSLVFYDAHGEDWQTAPLDWNADCATVTAALEELPNGAIPKDSVRCYKTPGTNGVAASNADTFDPIGHAGVFIHSKYTLSFNGNPGNLKQIEINKYLDGNRPTLFSDETASTLAWKIYPNGFIGENVDLVPDLCEDVLVTLTAANDYHVLNVYQNDAAAIKLLKICLGDSDGDSTNNVAEVYNWDYGNGNNFANPHLIKLVDATQDSSIATTDENGDVDQDLALAKFPISTLCADSSKATCAAKNPPGFYAVLFFDGSNFKIFNRVAQDYSSTTKFYVYTTTGHLQLVNPNTQAFSTNTADSTAVQVASLATNVLHLTQTLASPLPGFVGQIDCETTVVGVNGAKDCLKKDDYVIALSTQNTNTANNALNRNPVYTNLYKVKKISREPFADNLITTEAQRHQLVLDYSLNYNFHYAGVAQTNAADSSANIYKFYPPAAAKQYHYAGECSHRGLCNTKTGLCQCFPGYSEDNCGVVNAISN